MTNDENRPPIWEAFCTAVGTEYRENKSITGASGITHPVEAIGVDDIGKRVVLISGDYNPRSAALMRIDVQATMKDVRVLVARPLALDLAHAAREMFFTNTGILDISKVTQLALIPELGDNAGDFMKEVYGEPMNAVMNSIKRSNLPARAHILNFIEQITSVDWTQIDFGKNKETMLQTAVEVLSRFSEIDNLSADRKHGICPIPTYELTDSDWDLFYGNQHIEEARDRLVDLNIYQYFYPPKDSLALALIDNGFANQQNVNDGMQVAVNDGHPFSSNELLRDVANVAETLELLKQEGYVAEGEFDLELTEAGKSFRQSVKFRPSESLSQKIARIVSVKVSFNLNDLFKP